MNRGQVQLEHASILINGRISTLRGNKRSLIPYALLPQLFKNYKLWQQYIEFVFRSVTSEVTRFLRPEQDCPIGAVGIGTTTLRPANDLETGEEIV